MKVFKIINGKIESNVYVVTYRDQTYIIDPGFDYNAIFKYVDDNKLKVKSILLTHGHYDHCSAVDKIVEKYNVPVFMDLKDMIFIDSPHSKINTIKGMSVKLNSKIEDISNLNDINVNIYHSPGHSPGGVVIQFKNESSLFVGDTIFKESIGRVDLPGSSSFEMNSSLSMILSFPPKTILYPGHGENTTVEHEIRFNPFIK